MWQICIVACQTVPSTIFRWFHYLSTLQSQELKTCLINVEKDHSKLLNWSNDNNLVFNAIKTEILLLAMAEIKACHKLDEIKDLEIKCMEKQLELPNECKVLGVTID